MRPSGKSTRRNAAPFLMSRRQALTVALAGLVSGLGAGRLRADAIVPAQVPTAARPTAVKLFTASGAGDQDGRDWQNAMPIGELSKALSSARPGTGFLIGTDRGGQPIAIGKGQIRINVSGDEDSPIFLQSGHIAHDDGIVALSEEAASPGPSRASAGAAPASSPWPTARPISGSPASASTAHRRTDSSSSAASSPRHSRTS
jgi:hypothetical protein